MPVVVRRATIDDAEAVTALGHALNEHEGDPLEFWTLESVRSQLFGSEPQMIVLIAEVDGRPAGYAGFHEAWDSPHAARGLFLADLYVDEAFRRRGVGRALMAAMSREVKQRGKSFFWWTRKAANERAGAFYRRLGAKEEPVVAHALHGDDLDSLAKEAGE
jgi:GNAT superfamily N-acetyltransferase